jgi:hypothetical protein
MNINAIILEQIEWDGTAKAFQLNADQSIGDLWIAFPEDYSQKRNAPFYFLDKEYEAKYQSKLANCREIRLAPKNFYQADNEFIFKTTWQRIPTISKATTYYALYLPEFAIPTEIKVTDTRNPEKEFSKNVFRDDEKNRFVTYIECSSKFGQFNFNIFCKFHFDKTAFSTSKYVDAKTKPFYAPADHWKWMMEEDDVKEIEQIFITHNHNYTTMGDQYNVEKAGAVGPFASADNTTFNEVQLLPDNTNYNELTKEIAELKAYLLSKATSPEHYSAIGEVAKAEEAAKSKEGNKVLKSLRAAGKWVLDGARDVATGVLAEIVKSHMGT